MVVTARTCTAAATITGNMDDLSIGLNERVLRQRFVCVKGSEWKRQTLITARQLQQRSNIRLYMNTVIISKATTDSHRPSLSPPACSWMKLSQRSQHPDTCTAAAVQYVILLQITLKTHFPSFILLRHAHDDERDATLHLTILTKNHQVA